MMKMMTRTTMTEPNKTPGSRGGHATSSGELRVLRRRLRKAQEVLISISVIHARHAPCYYGGQIVQWQGRYAHIGRSMMSPGETTTPPAGKNTDRGFPAGGFRPGRA